jgi:cytidine deaminase
MTSTFEKLFEFAKSRYNPRTISPLIQAGEVSAAILTKAGNVYTGVCIDTACTLGMCAERNAIANMITNGESKIDKLVCYLKDDNGNDMVGSPCGACREYLMQLDEDSGDIEILADLATGKTVRLRELIPDWWGERCFETARGNAGGNR